jgi:hypothetical protein
MEKREVKPRGFYLSKEHEKWSKDKTVMHYEGPWMQFYYPLIKIGVITVFFLFNYLLLGFWKSLGLSIFVILVYPYWVASVVPNTIVMPSMDGQTYVSNPKQIVNYMNCSMYDKRDI